MIFTFDSVNWFNKIIRPFFASIDVVIYKLIGWILEGILNLSDLFANPVFVKTIYRRIYVVLAIFMVFKLTFSFIQYLINPDAMTDKERGVGKLISRTIVMLVLIIFVPILFFEEITVSGSNKGTLLNVLQKGVLKTLPQIVLGIDASDVNENSSGDGESIALMMLGSLYYKSDCEKSDSNCETGLKAAISDFNSFEGSINMNSSDSSSFDYSYVWPLTTISGIMLVVILLGIAVDVAIRVFKIMILQMIAPIPIMSYMDPKSSKDGAFSSWVKTYISTYLDVFVKVGTVYLLMLLIGNLFTDDGIFGNQIKAHTGFMTRSFLIIFLTIGLFKFAKDAPKFIKDAMGIKDSGGDGIFGGLKALGAATGAVAGGAAGFAGGVAGGIASARAAGQGGFMGAMKGLGGGVAGAFRGTAQGAKGAAKGNPLKGISGALQAQNAITKRKMETAAMGSTWGGRMGARFGEFFTGQTAADRDKEQMDEYKEAIDGAKGFKSVLADSAGKSDAIIGGTNLKQFKADVEAAKSGDAAALSRLKNYGFSKKITTTASNGAKVSTTVGDLSAAIAGSAKFEKDWQKSYYNEVSAGRITDGDAQAVISAKSVADAGIRGLNLHDSTGAAINEVNADNAGMVIGIATNESNKIASSTKYKSNKANAEAIKRGK